MAQGQMIKGQTPTKLNKDVQVDENGYIILSPSTTIAVTGGGSSGIANFTYVQKDTTTDVTYKYYGYMDAASNWCVKRIHRTTNLAEFAVAAVQSPSVANYTDAWTGRVTLDYVEYGSAF